MNLPLHRLDDQQLVRLFHEGNERAFEIILKRHKSRIYTTIYLIAKDRDMAEDLFQEVMIKIINTIRGGTYNEEGKFLPWACRIAHNLAIDHFRKAQRYPMLRETETFDPFMYMSDHDPGPQAQMETAQSHAQLHDCIEKLPETQREVLIMRHYGDLSFKEIADMTQVSINTALGRMRYALINLRKMMGGGEILSQPSTHEQEI